MKTNKLAAQIDRPLNASIVLGGPSCLVEPGNLATPSGLVLQRLCDGGSDGALIHGVWAEAQDILDEPTKVLLYVSDQDDPSRITPENTRLVALGALTSAEPLPMLDVNFFWFNKINFSPTEAIEIVSGDATSLITVERPAPGPAFDPTITWAYRPTTLGAWSDWQFWAYPADGFEGYWERRRTVASTEVDRTFQVYRAVGGTLPLPSSNGAYTGISSTAKEQKHANTFSATATAFSSPWEVERGARGEIYELVYVQGNASEVPADLITGGTRRRGAEVIINKDPAITASSSTAVQSSDWRTVVFASQTTVVELPMPSGFSALMDDTFGTIPGGTVAMADPFRYPGYSLSASTLGPGRGPVIGSLTYEGIALNVSLWSDNFVEGSAATIAFDIIPNLVILDENKIALLSQDPAPYFGLLCIERDNDVVEIKTPSNAPIAALPFVYNVLDGDYTDLPFSYSLVSDIATALAPLPAQFQWIGVEGVGLYPPDTVYDLPGLYDSGTAYESPDLTDIRITTFADVASNFREDPDWFDMGGTGLPSIPGSYPERVIPLPAVGSRPTVTGDNIAVVVSTTYGLTDFCRNKLLALGFTAADLLL